jgi:hypothetical protein
MIRRNMKRLALFLYVALIPITFPFLGLEGIKVTLKMAWRGLTQRSYSRRRALAGTAEAPSDAMAA